MRPALPVVAALAVAATTGAVLLSPVDMAGAARAVSAVTGDEVRDPSDPAVRQAARDRAATDVTVSALGEGTRSALGSSCFSSASGDVTDLDSGEAADVPRADITNLCVENAETITLSMRLADPSAAPEPAVRVLDWGLDLDGDEAEDVYVDVDADGRSVTVVDDRDGEVLCETQVVSGASDVTVRFPAVCVGSPSGLGANAFALYVPDMDDADGPSYGDLTEMRGPVSRSGAAPGPRRVADRIQGGNRITTAVEISKVAFPDGSSTVYLANADNYPDALAGGSLTNGPILLVPKCGELPAPVAAEIRRLQALRVMALGGGAAVCDDMLNAARDS